jgi:hypothetical protein
MSTQLLGVAYVDVATLLTERRLDAALIVRTD